MTQLITMLHLSQPVVVSPSMSGSFSLPYLTAHPGDIKGFIPVAPVMSGNFISKYPNIKVNIATATCAPSFCVAAIPHVYFSLYIDNISARPVFNAVDPLYSRHRWTQTESVLIK